MTGLAWLLGKRPRSKQLQQAGESVALIWLWVKTNGIRFWGRCTTQFRTYASGDWDVHWGYDLDFDPWPLESFRACSQRKLCESDRVPEMIVIIFIFAA